MIRQWVAAIAMAAMMTGQASADEKQAVRALVNQWFVALNAMLNGDPTPFADIYSHADNVIYMGAEGTYRVGWEATYSDWLAQAKKSTGGKVRGEDIEIIVSGDMAFAAHLTIGSAQEPDGTTTETRVRETSLLRKEAGSWKIIAHHADGLPYWEKAFGN